MNSKMTSYASDKSDNELEDSDIEMRTTAYQLHRQGGGVVVLDLGVVVVEREQDKQQQM